MWHLPEKLDAKGFEKYLAACLAQGVNTFDHADIYGAGESERLFGAAWKTLGVPRDRITLISKCGNIQPRGTGDPLDEKFYDTSRQHILASVDGSLSRLQTDHLDLFLIHRYDPMLNFSEVAEVFDSLAADGKVLAFGVSNYPPHQFLALNRFLGGRLVSNQVECSIFHAGPFMDGTFDDLQADGLVPMAWSPLGGRFGARLSSNPRLDRVVRHIASCSDLTPEAVAIRWLATHPSGILPVIGTSQVERMTEAVRAAASPLARNEWFAILSAALETPMP